MSQLRILRRAGRLGEFVSISYLNKEVHVSSENGRVCRPLIVCDSGLPRVDNIHIQALKNGDMICTTLINRGLIEYIDVNEENNALIALHESMCNQNTTHLEIEAFSIL